MTSITAPQVCILQAETLSDIEIFRLLAAELFADYGFDLQSQGIDEEMATLPGKYASPLGAILLAFVDDVAVGCVAMRPLKESICEMKRLYVRAEYRSLQLGRRLSEELIHLAGTKGYNAMRLDTRRELMPKAVSLYTSLGFYEIPPYNESPFPDIYYMECLLLSPTR
jgi:putative acetyltransferase